MFNFLDMANNYEERKVARFEKDGVMVDTCSVNDGRKPFETAVEHPMYNRGKMVIVDCYNTKGEARVGHDKWVKIMTSQELPKSLVDCGNSEISQFVENRGGQMEFPKESES